MNLGCVCGGTGPCQCPTPKVEQVNNMPGHRNPPPPPKKEQVNHPQHYGGENNPYEAIKVIEAWDLGFLLGNCVKYISRLGKKGDILEDARKAQWYLNRFVSNLEKHSGK